METAVKICNLKKQYKDVMALNDVTLDIPTGKIFGLVGPNGSGKTTLIKILVGLLRPMDGRAEVLGFDPIKDSGELQKHIGYMPQNPSLYEDLTAKDNVTFFAESLGVRNSKTEVAGILNFVELGSRAGHRVHTFSGGMKKRVSLACTLVHRPKLIFLDEPTAAIDPELKLKIWELLRKLADEGATLFVSTNIMDEAVYCDQVAILRKGKVIFNDSPKKFLTSGQASVELTYASEKKIKEEVAAKPEDIAKFLKNYGLDKEITAVDIEPESFERVLLRMVKK